MHQDSIDIVLKLKKTRSIKCLVAALLCFILVNAEVQTVNAQGNYESKQTQISKFVSIVNQHPGQAGYWSIGKTVLGNNIWMFFFGNTYGRRILVEAQTHGSEDLGTEMMILTAKWLFSSDPDAKYVLKNCAVYMVPVLNVDSYGRRNAHGVDLYYNYPKDWGWSGDGSSSRYSEEYRGPYALSEPESKAMHQTFVQYGSRFKYYLSIHQGGGPYLGYYRYISSAAISGLMSKISQISSSRGVTPYSYKTVGDPGSVIRDAYSQGIQPWLLEANSGSHYRPDSSTIPSYYRRALPILIAMAYA